LVESQLKTGTKSLAPSTWPQVVQWLRPSITDSPLHILQAMQFKKDPITRPKTAVKT
jgi:hypothetical protein